jgi:hypothetical protein
VIVIRHTESLDGYGSDQQPASGLGFGSAAEQGRALPLITAKAAWSHTSHGIDAEERTAGVGGPGIGCAGKAPNF